MFHCNRWFSYMYMYFAKKIWITLGIQLSMTILHVHVDFAVVFRNLTTYTVGVVTIYRMIVDIHDCMKTRLYYYGCIVHCPK